MTRLKVDQRPFLHTSSPFRLPELQRLIEVMGHCMRRVFGISKPLPVALHTVASQHILTLHNTSGTHILGYVPAQVKHHLIAASFFELRAPQFANRIRVHDAHDPLLMLLRHRAAIVLNRKEIVRIRPRCEKRFSVASAPFLHTRTVRM
jgi:hypothetical protein